MSDAARIAELEQELRALANAARRLVQDLERIARIQDDAKRGQELKRYLRSSPSVLPVPSK